MKQTNKQTNLDFFLNEITIIWLEYDRISTGSRFYQISEKRTNFCPVCLSIEGKFLERSFKGAETIIKEVVDSFHENLNEESH